MLSLPPALLDLLRLAAGSQVGVEVDDGRLVVSPLTRPRYSLAEILAASDYGSSPPSDEREWVDAPTVGRERA